MIKQLSIFDMPAANTNANKGNKKPLTGQTTNSHHEVSKTVAKQEHHLLSLNSLMHHRFGITRHSKLSITPKDTYYAIFRKLAYYLAKNGDWSDQDYLQAAATIGRLVFGKEAEATVHGAQFVDGTDNPMIYYKHLQSAQEADEQVIKIEFVGESKRNCYLRLTDTPRGNSLSGQMRYFRAYPTFIFSFINRKKLIGYGKLIAAIYDAYDRQKPDFERDFLDKLLLRLLINKYGTKRYSSLFQQFPVPDVYSEALHMSKVNWHLYREDNAALQFVEDFVLSNYNIVISQQYEDVIRKTTRARAWQTKKHIKDTTQQLMRHNSLLTSFKSVELDNDVDYYDFKVFADEVNSVLNVLPHGLQQPILRLRRLGNYHALGMYVPAVNNIVIDFRGPGDSELVMTDAGFRSFIHEYGHYLDYQTQNGKQLSLLPEFANVVNRYRDHILNGDVHLPDPHYYCAPTEVFARCFELYVSATGLKTGLLKSSEKYQESPEYQAIDSQMLAEATKFFDTLFPQYRQNLNRVTK